MDQYARASVVRIVAAVGRQTDFDLIVFLRRIETRQIPAYLMRSRIVGGTRDLRNRRNRDDRAVKRLAGCNRPIARLLTQSDHDRALGHDRRVRVRIVVIRRSVIQRSWIDQAIRIAVRVQDLKIARISGYEHRVILR
ncbi:hypothetical protein D3C73_1233750 [compost metagenome]